MLKESEQNFIDYTARHIKIQQIGELHIIILQCFNLTAQELPGIFQIPILFPLIF